MHYDLKIGDLRTETASNDSNDLEQSWKKNKGPFEEKRKTG